MTIEVKICGLSTVETLDAALGAGADIVGFVSFAKSPRHMSAEQAAVLAERARTRARIALLTVDADDALLADLVSAVSPDILQLHGGESPERIKRLRTLYGREIWKAVPLSIAADLAVAEPFWETADRVLFDAKPPKGSALPGGNGVAFDWGLIVDLDPARRFVLSGGLTPETVTEAVRATRAPAVDVSSGVESAPGIKDPDKIAAFVRAARSAAT